MSRFKRLLDSGLTVANFNYQLLSVPILTSSNRTFSDTVFNVSGNRLIVLPRRCSVDENFSLKFNETGNPSVPIVLGADYRLPFDKIVLNGTINISGIGSGAEPKALNFLIFDDEHLDFSFDPEVLPTRTETISSGTTQKPDGDVKEVWATSLGTVNYDDQITGSTVSLTGVPAYTRLPITPQEINAASTASVLLVYYDMPIG